MEWNSFENKRNRWNRIQSVWCEVGHTLYIFFIANGQFASWQNPVKGGFYVKWVIRYCVIGGCCDSTDLVHQTLDFVFIRNASVGLVVPVTSPLCAQTACTPG